jgi:methylthioribose-1-phosphate isomerase
VKEIQAIQWDGAMLHLLDQTLLPFEESWLQIGTYSQAIAAISEMRVRGAPAIGITAGYALTLASRENEVLGSDGFLDGLEKAAMEIVAARPTAVNLWWAVDRMMRVARSSSRNPGQVSAALAQEALRMHAEDVEANRRMGGHGATLLPDGGAVLTHCNTGALATAGYGTALGVIRAAWEQGKRFQVYADETRPFLQGARLTMWELKQLGIPATLLVDSAAGSLIRLGGISCAIVGADRIAANGDVANKIGTYSVAVLAKENGIPFYVAAPVSTVDISVLSGDAIPIEERDPREVTHFGSREVATPGVRVYNPSFDVTPNRYVTAIITDMGVVRPPYEKSLSELIVGQKRAVT